MLNFSIIGIISIISISQNILLLNEETLILFCFILFCWLMFKNLNSSIQSDLSNRANQIEFNLLDSLDQVINFLRKTIHLQSEFLNLVFIFKSLSRYFLNLTFSLSKELPICSKRSYNVLIPKKLIFTQRLEKQVSKIIALLIVKKLHKIVILKQFYIKNIEVSSFVCLNKINIREYINTV